MESRRCGSVQSREVSRAITNSHLLRDVEVGRWLEPGWCSCSMQLGPASRALHLALPSSGSSVLLFNYSEVLRASFPIFPSSRGFDPHPAFCFLIINRIRRYLLGPVIPSGTPLLIFFYPHYMKQQFLI